MTVRRTSVIGGFALAGLAVALAISIVVVFVVQYGRVLPNTFVDGVDVGGHTPSELVRTVQALARDRESEPVVFVLEDDEFVLDPAEVGYALDVEATADAAYERGRTGWFGGIPERVRSLRNVHEVGIVERWDDVRIDAWVEDLADTVDRPVFHGNVEIDPQRLEVAVAPAHSSVRVRVDDVREAIVDAMTTTGPARLELPADVEDPMVDPDDLLVVGDQARRALEDPITLTYGDVTLTLEPRRIAELLTIDRQLVGDRQEVTLAVTPGRVIVVLDTAEIEQFSTEPRDAGFHVDREPPVSFDDQGSTSFQPVQVDVAIASGQAGTRLDPRTTAEQLTEMLRSGTRTAQKRLEIVEPELPTELAQELRPTHLLGTFTTYHAAGQARVTNIQRLADTIDGTVVPPGDQFSINGVSGRRTCESGYVPAGTIVAGELVDTCGGGTSQFGTTTYNAAFFAGVQIDQWKAHSWYISRYPMGREATLNYPELDVKFTNDTNGAILVKTSHSPTSITVSLYGRPIASEVRARLGSQTNFRSPGTQVRRTRDLYEDQERVLQPAGSRGFTVRVVREIVLLDGTVRTENIDTVYVPQHRIVERGTRPRPD